MTGVLITYDSIVFNVIYICVVITDLKPGYENGKRLNDLRGHKRFDTDRKFILTVVKCIQLPGVRPNCMTGNVLWWPINTPIVSCREWVSFGF